MRGVGDTPPEEPPRDDPCAVVFECVAVEVLVVSFGLEPVGFDVADVDDVVIDVVEALAAGEEEAFEPPHALSSATTGSTRKRCERALTIPA
jgi:hypothetical protein